MDILQALVPSVKRAEPEKVDVREQLCNNGEQGAITAVQVSAERIVAVRGILFDLDPQHYRMSLLTPVVPRDAHEFYRSVASKWLDRHPLLRRAEVRLSGTGLHAILQFRDPVELASDEDRRRWTGIIKVIQCALPIDPEQPHITALTRPIGSLNSKNGAEVRLLKPGEPITHEEALDLYRQMCDAPFLTAMKILAGADKLQPCPRCAQVGSQLAGMSRVGLCYGSCGKVKLEQLYDLVFAPRVNASKEVKDDDASGE